MEITKRISRQIKKRKQMKFDYKDLLNNGFKREDCNDSVFFDQYGFQYFIFTKELRKNFYFDWNVNTQELTLVKTNYEYNIIYKKIVDSIEEYKLIEELLK
jgi:hypothetical protein